VRRQRAKGAATKALARDRACQRLDGAPRARDSLGQGRPKAQSARSSAKSGDSGDDSESSEPPERRACQYRLCQADISHLCPPSGPPPNYCDQACKQAAYRDRKTVAQLDELVGTPADQGTLCKGGCSRTPFIVDGACFWCGKPLAGRREWVTDDGLSARSFVVTPAARDSWRVRPDRQLSAELRRTLGRWDAPAREVVA
jgi:hypothetical protein